MTDWQTKADAAYYWSNLTPVKRCVLTPEWCEDCLALSIDPLEHASPLMQLAIAVGELLDPLIRLVQRILDRIVGKEKR